MKVADLKNLFKGEEKGVSPVIGVILMVAVTVILAAVIGAFVMNMGDNLSQSAPQANFNYDYNSDNGLLTVTHDGGDSFTDKNSQSLAIQADDNDASNSITLDWSADSGPDNYPISAGDNAQIDTGSSDDTTVSPSTYDSSWTFSTGDEVRVIWTSDAGDSTQTVGSYTIP